ncbi:2250_t:CDS:2 [Entrophospora sp. SA101]|nr:2250_t:CDS:2 [Entrophospora sp. SA101]CAJ0909172.1 18738_t:CDS:2 [Entrophospora sp. SA101]CAJ0909192.1 18743_t:CDS:2 [Entrophospora sp. SA101]
MSNAKGMARIPIRSIMRLPNSIKGNSRFDKLIEKKIFYSNYEKLGRKNIKDKLPTIQQKIKQPINPHILKVTIIGTANSGKSTLINSLIGDNVTIVSDKPHTTRERVSTILTIFLDTPVILVIDALKITEYSYYGEQFIIEKLKTMKKPIILIFNKNLELLTKYPFLQNCPTISISALHNIKLNMLKRLLLNKTYPNDWLYQSDQKVDSSLLKRIEEFIREEILTHYYGYFPYTVTQENVGWKINNNTLRIDQNIYVKNQIQQKILIGSEGKLIKNIANSLNQKIKKIIENEKYLVKEKEIDKITLYLNVKKKK